MLSIVQSLTLNGMEGYLIQVEVDVSNGLPAFDIVGLPAATVREAKERVRTAIRNSGFNFPLKRITVNLAPADLKKDGPGLDLPIAVGILQATEQLACAMDQPPVFLGELSLDGSLKAVPGVLPMACALVGKAGVSLVLPQENSREGSLVRGLKVYGSQNLSQVVRHIRGEEELAAQVSHLKEPEPRGCLVDFSDIKGQGMVKRALEVAAAGNHNLLLIGPPGTGKTMLARALPGIMPRMSFLEALEVSKVYSVAGLLPQSEPLILERPFRSPHHSTTMAGITGGGKIPKPGEISLANRGVLFLDELPEFNRQVLEVLRQPLEDRVITLARAAASHTYPARIMLAASLNPCPCGMATENGGINCTCTPLQVAKYQARISGPLLDRIDIQIEVPRVPYEELSAESEAENSMVIRERVEKAREVQRDRFGGTDFTNSEMSSRQLRLCCRLNKEGKELLSKAYKLIGLTARGYDRVLKVARTIADLAGSPQIKVNHLTEALQYRAFDRGLKRS